MSELFDISSNPDTIIIKINCEAITCCWRCFPISKKYWSFSVLSDVDLEDSKRYFCIECRDWYPEQITWIKVKILRSDLEALKEEFKSDGYVLTQKNNTEMTLSSPLLCDEVTE